MKVTIEFDTDDPQNAVELKGMLKAQDMRIALWDINNLFRTVLKYENQVHKDYLTDEEEIAIEHVQKQFLEVLEEYDLTQYVLEME